MGMFAVFIGFGLGIAFSSLMVSAKVTIIDLLQWQLLIVEWLGLAMAASFLPLGLVKVIRGSREALETYAIGLFGLMIPMFAVACFPSWPRSLPERLVYLVLGGTLG